LRPILGFFNGIPEQRHRHAHDHIDSGVQENRDDVSHVFRGLVAFDEIILGPAGMGIAKKPISADNEAGQGNTAHHGSRKCVHFFISFRKVVRL
jgi:hypothetical protein